VTRDNTSDWRDITRGVKIKWDLQDEPLQIKTHSVIGSFAEIDVHIFTADGSYIGFFNVHWFYSTVEYFLTSCTTAGYDEFDWLPSAQVDLVLLRKVISCSFANLLSHLYMAIV